MKSKYQSVNEQREMQEEMLLKDYLHSLDRRDILEEDIVECPVCFEESLMICINDSKAIATCGNCGIKTTIDF